MPFSELGTRERTREQCTHTSHLQEPHSLVVTKYGRDAQGKQGVLSKRYMRTSEEGWGDGGDSYTSQEFDSGTSNMPSREMGLVMPSPRCSHTRLITSPLFPPDHNLKLGKHTISYKRVRKQTGRLITIYVYMSILDRKWFGGKITMYLGGEG